MGMTSTVQVARLLALVPYLQAHPDADLADTARVFGVRPDKLVSDLKVLWYCGLPGGLPGDLIEVDMDALEQGRIRLTNAEFLSRPLRLRVEEAQSLIVALRALEEMADVALAPAVASARGKLEAAFGGGAERVDVSVQAGSEGVRDALAGAIFAGKAVRLTYHGASRSMVTSPVVDPVRLGTSDGYGYLTAWAHERAAWRSYRLDRITAAESTGVPAGVHGEPPTLGPGWLDERPEAAEVALEVGPGGAWIAEYLPLLDAEARPGGGVRLRLLVADPGWFRRLLLRLGPAVRSVDPPQAATSAIEVAREALAGA